MTMTDEDQMLEAFRKHLIETGKPEMAKLPDHELVEALKTVWPMIAAEKRRKLH